MPGRFDQRRYAYAVFAVLAVLLVLPALFAQKMHYDSFWIDQVWSQQFTSALKAGNPYPRWLPLSYGGLGAPVFYFYAPGSFYLAGLFGLAGLGTYPALMAAFCAAWFASGATMYAWLRDWARQPLLGALIYMVLPYHIIDFYGRGAIAEFCAVALIPLVAIGVRRATHEGRTLPLALGYAALILTHLPMAVITGVLLIAPAALWQSRRDLVRLVPVAVGGVLGVFGAAFYLLPALTLQHHTSMSSLWGVAFLQPSSWSLLHPALWPSKPYVLLFSGLATAIALAAILPAVRARGFWPVWTVAVCAVIVGLVPGFWALPAVSAVQFPWRALALAEFGLATAVACYAGRPVAMACLLTPLAAMSVLMWSPHNPMNGETAPPLPVRGMQDVVEYLPAGAVDSHRRVDEALVRAASDEAARHPGASFRFPALSAHCVEGAIVPMVADPSMPLVIAPPRGCARTVVRLPIEKIGLAISLLAWLAAFCGLRIVSPGAVRQRLRRLFVRDGSLPGRA